MVAGDTICLVVVQYIEKSIIYDTILWAEPFTKGFTMIMINCVGKL